MNVRFDANYPSGNYGSVAAVAAIVVAVAINVVAAAIVLVAVVAYCCTVFRRVLADNETRLMPHA